MAGQVTERIPAAGQQSVPSELRSRILYGVLLAALALGANWAGALVFALLVAGIGLVLSWEWCRIVRSEPLDAGFIIHGAAVVAGVGLTVMGRPGTACAVAGVAALLTTLAVGRQTILSGIGPLYVGLPAIALVWLRSDASYGVLAILFIYAAVWATDTFAFICGKLIGGPKLWPRISPNKTWSGTLGGLGFAALAGAVLGWSVGHPSPGILAVAGGILSIAAQIGDLAESSLKRTFGIKHASHLIPGHGGFMDRMDGIVAAAGVAALVALAINRAAPARALLFWS